MAKLNPHTQFRQIRNATVGLDVLTTNYAEHEINLNKYPANAWFGNGVTSLPEAIRGSILIPSNSAPSNHGSGVAGYALTNSTSKGSVGVFGYGGVQTDGCSAWGANFLVTNTGQPQSGSNTGHTNTVMYGIEIDINVQKLGDGSTPNVAVNGISLIGACEVKPPNCIAVNVDSIGYNQSPPIKWDTALKTVDGSCVNAIIIGTSDIGNNVGSQAILFNSRDGAAVNRQSFIIADPSGNIIVQAGAAGQTIIKDGGGNIAAAAVVNGVTPRFNIPGVLTVASAPPATAAAVGIAGTITYDTNFIYVCTAANTWKRAALATW